MRFYAQMQSALEQGDSLILMTSLGAQKGAKAFLNSDILIVSDETMRQSWQAAANHIPDTLPQIQDEILYEFLCAHPKLIICGGGHVAHPLATFAQMLDFDVTVIDDRPEFANSERFPQANILCMPYEDALVAAPYGDDCYYVIVTPGHIADGLCLETILRKNHFAYCGMIGSRRKTSLLRQNMVETLGFSQELMDRVHMPIGLRIGATTPAEIAVCISAELIQVRSGSDGGIDRDGLAALANGEPMVLCTITKKYGSAPRGIGARLLVDQNGRTYGTIGGGAIEGAAIREAKNVLVSGQACFFEQSMTNDDARREGMICGGTVTVLMERIN